MKTEWRDEFFAGVHYYNLFLDEKKIMFAGYSAEELSNGNQKIVVNGEVVKTHSEARKVILEQQNIKV